MLKNANALATSGRNKFGLGCSFFLAMTMTFFAHGQSSSAQTSGPPVESGASTAQPNTPPGPPPVAYPPPALPPAGYPPPGYGPYVPAYPPAYPGYPPPGYYYYPYGPPSGYAGTPAAPTVAAAAPAEASAPSPFTVAVDLGGTGVSETNSTTVVQAPLVDVAFIAHPALVLDLAWGFIAAIDGEGSTARLGNPLLTSTYRRDLDAWHFRASLGITAPVASYPLGPDGRLYAFDYNQTMALWGMWNAWLWTPNRMALPLSARTDRRLGAATSLRGELALAPVFGVRGNASGTDTFAQLAVEAGLAIGTGLVLRPRLQLVVLPRDSVDRSQAALGLRGVLKTRYGDYFAGLLLNLDKPYGVFGGLGRWGLHLGKEIDL